MQLEDKELARRAANGRRGAFEEIVMRYGGLIKAIVRYHMKDMQMWHDDCINEALLAVWQNISRYDPDKNSLKNWIGAVAKYKAIDFRRRYFKGLESEELDDSIADSASADAELMRREAENELIEMMSCLNEEDRDIFIRRYILCQSVEDISSVIGKKPSAVYNRLSRGRKKLKRLYIRDRSDQYEKRV